MTLDDYALWFAMTSELTVECFTTNEYDEVDSITISDGTSREVLP